MSSNPPTRASADIATPARGDISKSVLVLDFLRLDLVGVHRSVFVAELWPYSTKYRCSKRCVAKIVLV